jgi:diamine N-acetyltransferase
MMGVFRGEKIELRALEPEDLEFLYDCENNTDIWRVSNTLTPYSKYYLKQYIADTHNDIFIDKQLRLMIVLHSQNKVIGTIDLFDFDSYNMRAGVGILINEKEYRGNGYATEALRILIKYSFDQLLLHQLYCNIADDNRQSIVLFEKEGFVNCGLKKEWLRIQGGWRDELMYQKINPKTIEP